MSKAITLILLLSSVTAGTAHAEILNLRCERPPGGISNVYRYDLVIDLAKKAVQAQQFSTLKDNNHTFTYRNHKADMNAFLDDDQYVLVSDDRIQWGDGSPKRGRPNVYYRQQKVLDNDLAKYQCTER